MQPPAEEWVKSILLPEVLLLERALGISGIVSVPSFSFASLPSANLQLCQSNSANSGHLQHREENDYKLVKKKDDYDIDK